MARKYPKAGLYKLAAIGGGAIIGTAAPFVGLAFFGVAFFYAGKVEAKEAASLAQARAEKKAEFRRSFYGRQHYASYADYLQSDVWARKRAAVIKRSGGRCEHATCNRMVEEVHHLYYPRVWGTERIESLKALCESHHEEAHGLGTQAREH